MWKGPCTKRGRRTLRALSPTVVISATLAMLLSTLSGGPASAGVAAPAPVVGVDAFGIGFGQLGGAYGIAVDSKGDLFVADETSSRVIEYTPGSGTSYSKVGTIVAGAGGQGSGLSQLNFPGSVALDASGDLFVSDTANARIMEYTYNTLTGSYAATGRIVAGTGTAGSGLRQLNEPGGVAFDAEGDLFVADTGNNRVVEFAYNSGTGTYASTATKVAGTGTQGSGANQLGLPGSVALDAKGDLFVADYANARVMEYTFNAATGTYATSGTEMGGGLPDPAGALAWDANGDLFVTYGYLGYGGVLEFPYNSATGTFASSGTAIDPSAMVGPDGIAFDSHGDLFVAETSQTSDPSQTVWNMVLEFTYSPATSTFSPLGTVMGQLGRTNTGISAIGLDTRGNLFVSDGVSDTGGPAGVFEFPYNASTQAYSLTGSVITATAGNALALDGNNDLFVAESTGVLEFPYNSSSAGYPASGVAVPGATQLATLTGISAIAVDSKNDLFVATDTSGSGTSIQGQVLEFAYNSASGTWAASGNVLVTVNYSGAPILIGGVGGITVDGNGNLFVSNSGAGQVQEYLYNASTGRYATTGTTVAGAGGTGSGTNQLDEPTGLAVDGSGNLFVFDAGNGGRIMEFTGNPAMGVYAANGTAIFTGSVDNWPESGGVTVDSRGDVLFGNNLLSAVVYEASASSSAPPTTAPPTTAPPTTAPPTTAPPTTAPPTTAPPTTAPPTTVPASNLVPDPGFESTGVPLDYWGSTVARSTAVVHSGSWALAQAVSSSGGGWDLDTNSGWYATVSAAKTYTASIWVQATAALKVDVNVDLLTASGAYVDTAGGSVVTLAPNAWTQLTLTGIKPTTSEAYAAMEPNFSKGAKGAIIYWDDMSVVGH
jgi:sugar lactone lactonase YvrE